MSNPVRIPASDRRASALVTAIQGGDVAGLAFLLRETPLLATARIVDSRGVARTLLHVAADWPGHFPNGADVVATLVSAGAEVNAGVLREGPNGAGETALHWAASSNDVVVLDALLDHGAEIEATGAAFTGGPAMSDAVIFAQWDAARRLLERGATTTLWQAAALGLTARADQLCDQAPTQQITNAFWHACRGGQLETAQHLRGRGANLNWVGHDHKTPLDAALESAAAGLVEWLLANGAQRAVDLPEMD